MIISDIQSTQYSKHYGKIKQATFGTGEGLSPQSVLNGGVRGIFDTIEIDLIPPGDTAFGWKFSEDVTIMDATLRVTETHGPPSGIMVADIFDRDSENAVWIERLFSFATDQVRTWIGTHLWDAAIPKVTRGSVLGFRTKYGERVERAKISYSIQFMSSL